MKVYVLKENLKSGKCRILGVYKHRIQAEAVIAELKKEIPKMPQVIRDASSGEFSIVETEYISGR